MAAEFLRGGGEMGERIRAFDWSTTALGSVETWTATLQTAVALMLGARQPTYIAWGPELLSLYNDGYLPILGSKHPAALAQPFHRLWSEVWDQVGPLVSKTLAGEAQFFEDLPVPLSGRDGRPMSWFTFSWTPLRDQSGAVAGFYCAANETTDRVQAARDSAERLQLALDATQLGTFVWYPEEDRTEADERMLGLFGLTRTVDLNLAEALGKLIHPDDVERYGAAVGRAMDPAGSGTLREDIRVKQPDGFERWVAVTGKAAFEGDPLRAVRLNGTAADITERKREESRALAQTDQASFLVSLGDALRRIGDPVAIQETAAELLRAKLRTNRVLYFEATATNYVVERDAIEGVASLRGSYPIEAFGSALLAQLRSGSAVITDDVGAATDLSPAQKAEFAAIQIGAHITVPLVKGGSLVAGLAAQNAEPRAWSEHEVSLVAEVAERTWSAVERSRAEAAVRTSEAKYRSLFESMDQGYCIVEVLFDAEERPFDYRFIEVNPAYEKQAGLTHVVGRTASELVPGLNVFWFETFGRIARSGEPERFQSPAVGQDYSRIFDVFAFRVGDADQRRVAVLFTDVSSQVQAREALREAGRRKDEFLATLAHELRNPLAPLRTGLELLRLSGSNHEPFDRVRGMMERQVEHMVRMIDDLLDVSRITSGRIHLQRKPTPIDQLVKGAVEAAMPAIETARLALDVTVPERCCLVDVDATRIVQVLSNLLNNAIKFTPPHGRVAVDVRTVPGADGAEAIEVAVSDTGEGIAAQLLPQVFELFTQGERTSRGAQAGLGIGLALSRQLVELHGGRISARSEGADRGTTVTFTLPLVTPGPALPEPATIEPSPIRRRVLIVDDNHDAADAMGMLIEQFGGESRVVYDGESGVREASCYQPDVVFLDVGMPGLDGYDACRSMRSAGVGAVIVALTGWGQEHDKQRAADAGFDAHLTKPADPKAIGQLLGARQSV